jgi:hypothetical protein
MSTQQDAAEVMVVLTGCAPEDADRVFGALGAVFPACSGLGPGHPGVAGARREHPVVWTNCFDVRSHGEAAHHTLLGGPVKAALLGGTHAVREIEDALSKAFAVEEIGKVAGDQEVEVRLRLTPRPEQ